MRSHILMPLPCKESTCVTGFSLGFGRTAIIGASAVGDKQYLTGFQPWRCSAPELIDIQLFWSVSPTLNKFPVGKGGLPRVTVLKGRPGYHPPDLRHLDVSDPF